MHIQTKYTCNTLDLARNHHKQGLKQMCMGLGPTIGLAVCVRVCVTIFMQWN